MATAAGIALGTFPFILATLGVVAIAYRWKRTGRGLLIFGFVAYAGLVLGFGIMHAVTGH